MLSWIQYYILTELTRHATRRYSELRPRDVESNLFMYHLNGLLKDHFIEKVDRHYQLATKGLQFVGTLSLTTGRTRVQPKILNAIICQNEDGEYLWSTWHRQPNTGLVSFPHGMMHFGERVMDMALNELAEKAGFEADLVYTGDAYVRGVQNNTVDRHMLVHLFKGSKLRPAKRELLRPDISESFWSKLEDIPPERFVPGFYEIAQLVEKQQEAFIFADIEVTIQENDKTKVR